MRTVPELVEHLRDSGYEDSKTQLTVTLPDFSVARLSALATHLHLTRGGLANQLLITAIEQALDALGGRTFDPSGITARKKNGEPYTEREWVVRMANQLYQQKRLEDGESYGKVEPIEGDE